MSKERNWATVGWKDKINVVKTEKKYKIIKVQIKREVSDIFGGPIHHFSVIFMTVKGSKMSPTSPCIVMTTLPLQIKDTSPHSPVFEHVETALSG